MGKQDQDIVGARTRYHLVPRVLCFLLCGDQVLLLRGSPHKRLWPNLLNGIGGHVERGEDIAAAAAREIREETGLAVDDLRLRGLVSVDLQDDLGIGIYVYSAQVDWHPAGHSPEGSLEWHSVRQLPTDNLVEDVPVLLDRILTDPPSAPPFSAHYSYDVENRLLIRFYGPTSLTGASGRNASNT
jgi:8-oxo-dGTP diphosphatase